MDLYPWFCALYIEENHRGNCYPQLLLQKAKDDAKSGGFEYLYLSTDHIGYYEKYGFSYIGDRYHPWGENHESINQKNCSYSDIVNRILWNLL